MKQCYISILVISLLLLAIFTSVPLVHADNYVTNTPQPSKISPILRKILYENGNFEGVSLIGDVVKGKVIVSGNNIDSVLKYVKPYMVLKIPNGNTIIFGFYRLSDVETLSTLANVVYIMPDPQPYYGIPEPNEFLSSGEIGLNLYTMREILRVNDVESLYGYTGEDVVVAVIDTGVDYGQPNIRDKLIIDDNDNPLVFDPDAMGLIFPFYDFKAVDGYLQTAGVNVTIFTGWLWWLDIFEADTSYAWMNYTIPANFYVGNITSASGNYKLGFQVNYLYGVIIPVLLVDSETPGLYDTVYVDVSSIYKMVFQDKAPDYSFADENPYHKGDVIAEDFNGDDIPDISLGVVGGYFLDAMYFFGGGFKEGFSDKGEYLLLFYDFYGHGTACAGAIASSGTLAYDVYSENESISLVGIAKDAKILGMTGLFNGFVEAAWFFAAGFDTVVVDGVPYLVYSGQPRADIASNSWGISYYYYDYFLFGVDFESTLEMAFMIPGFLDPDFPGILMVQAGGNGGPGYGTITSPGAASLVLTVGASTSFHWVKLQTDLPIFYDYQGFYDNIIFWSLRGPTPLGDTKPDVVNIGAFGWVPGLIYGDGKQSFTFFGGTSMATPLTAGVAALLVQALKDKGINYDPFVLKSIIMSTTVDLNYPAFIQGAGRVDAYNAIKLVVDGGIYALSPDTWTNIYSQVYAPWFLIYGTLPPVSNDIAMPSIFAGYLMPGEVYNGTLTLTSTYTEKDVAVHIHDYELIKVGEEVYNFTSTGFENYTVPFIKVFDPEEFADADFVVIDLYTEYPYFDPYNMYWYSTYHALVFGEWSDLDQDGEIDDGEFARMNYAYARANVQELTLNNPYNMMADPDNNKLVLYVYRWSESPYDVPVIVRVVKYAKLDSPSVSVVNSSIVEANSAININYLVNASAEPGIYSAFIEVSYENNTITIPVSWSILYVVNSLEFTIGGLEPDDTRPYDSYSTLGRQQWGWRYESGDWRFFHVYIPPTYYGISILSITLEWQHPLSGYDFFVHTPYLIGYSDWGFYIGYGRHIWHTTLNETALIGWAYPSLDVFLYDYGIYTFAIRQYLYGGLFPAETFKLKVSILPAETFLISSLVAYHTFTINASEENPFYSVYAIYGIPNYLATVASGEASIYVVPSVSPIYVYSPLHVTISVIRNSTDTPVIAQIVYMGYREQPLVIKYYNNFYAYIALRLETYNFYCFSVA